MLPAEETLLFMLRDGQGLNPDPTGLGLILCPSQAESSLL